MILRAFGVVLVTSFALPLTHAQTPVSPQALTASIVQQAEVAGISASSAMALADAVSHSVLTEEQRLVDSNATTFDFFGAAVSLSGSRVLVGAYGDDCETGTWCGSAYVFIFDGRTWIEEAKLVASDASAGDEFGRSVSLFGDRALIGAPNDACNSGRFCGSVYVFAFDGTAWMEEAKITAADGATGDGFGTSVSLSGDRALVGAVGDDCTNGDDCGSAYVFAFDGSVWVEEAKLTASDNALADLFGGSVSLSGGRALVGAYGDACEDSNSCGSAYVFAFDGSVWVEEAKLLTSDAGVGDHFGSAVSLTGTRALIAAEIDACEMGNGCGSAYIFAFDGSMWSEEAKLVASDASAFDVFGSSVSLSGNRALIGAYGDDCDAGDNCGAAYVFVFDGSMWVEKAKLMASDASRLDVFGSSVSLSGDRVLIGAFGDACATGSRCGSAYVLAFQPLNDAYDDAAPITAVSEVTGSTVVATVEDGEPVPSCQSSTGASVWWWFEASATGTVTLDFASSDFDTVVSLYRSTNPTLPQATDELACNDDAEPGVLTSKLVDVPVEEGTQYALRVAGLDNGTEGPTQGTVAFDYTFMPTVVSEDDVEVGYALVVSPNPVANSLVVSMELASAVEATVEVVDALGRRVAVLAEGLQPVGTSSWQWAVDRQPAGVYVVRLRAGDVVRTQRVTVVR